VDLIKEVKATRQYYIGLIRGAPLPKKGDLTFKFLERSQYSDTQRAIRDLLQLQVEVGGSLVLTQSTKFIATIILTALDASRVFSLIVDPDHSPITAKYSGAADQELIIKEILEVVDNIGIDREEFRSLLGTRTRSWSHFVSEKGGPNGPATRSAGADAVALLANPDLMSTFIEVADGFDMHTLVSQVVWLGTTSPETVAKKDDFNLGRIHTIQEWGGKARDVAILDYFTQVLLDPLHKALGDVLRLLPTDAVYDQSKAAERVRGWTELGVPLWSFDLSRATDSLPLWVQQAVLGAFIGNQSLAAAWGKLLTERDYITESGRKIRYGTGQPMGAKSSFVVFDLTHHALVQLAASKAGFKGNFGSYVVIGDDITIADAKVAGAYKELMEGLNVKISLEKSLVHTDGYLPAGEMAKRLFISGIELSSIPIKLLARLPKSGKLGILVQEFVLSRGLIQAGPKVIQWLVGGMDRDSAVTMMKLNAAPGQVVGLSNSCGPYSVNLEVGNWSEKVTVTNEDVQDAYTFTLVAEQLKRLEALLRQAGLIKDSLEAMSRVTEKDFSVEKWWDSIPEKKRPHVTALLEQGSQHPIYLAAVDEARRVSSILSSLRAGTHSVTAAARLGLLDSLRNSVWTKTEPDSEDRAQVLYSVFLSSMVNLSKIVDLPGKAKDGGLIPRTLEFTIPILSIGRSYTVYWKLGGGVYVNMVRSRIQTDAVATESLAGSIADSIKMLTSVSKR
jgi:hypothetical protein